MRLIIDFANPHYLEHNRGTKFYAITDITLKLDIDGDIRTVGHFTIKNWGKITAGNRVNGQFKTESWGSEYSAQREVNNIVNSKSKRGYKVVHDNSHLEEGLTAVILNKNDIAAISDTSYIPFRRNRKLFNQMLEMSETVLQDFGNVTKEDVMSLLDGLFMTDEEIQVIDKKHRDKARGVIVIPEDAPQAWGSW